MEVHPTSLLQFTISSPSSNASAITFNATADINGIGRGHSRTNIYYVLVVTCDYFYGLEKLNVPMEYIFPKFVTKWTL